MQAEETEIESGEDKEEEEEEIEILSQYLQDKDKDLQNVSKDADKEIASRTNTKKKGKVTPLHVIVITSNRLRYPFVLNHGFNTVC